MKQRLKKRLVEGAGEAGEPTHATSPQPTQPNPTRDIIIHGEKETRVSKCISHAITIKKERPGCSPAPSKARGQVKSIKAKTGAAIGSVPDKKKMKMKNENDKVKVETGGETNPRSGPRISVIKIRSTWKWNPRLSLFKTRRRVSFLPPVTEKKNQQ